MNHRFRLHRHAIARLPGLLAAIFPALPAFAADMDRSEFFTGSKTLDVRQDDRKPAFAVE